MASLLYVRSIRTCWITRSRELRNGHASRVWRCFLSFFLPFFSAPNARQRMFLEYWYRSCWALQGRGWKLWTHVCNLRYVRDDASFRFHFFFIFYSRWTNPFLHSICIRARWLFLFLFFPSLSLSLERRVSKGSTRWSCDPTISVPFFIRSTFIFPFFPSFCFLINRKALKVSAIASLCYRGEGKSKQRSFVRIGDNDRHVCVIGIFVYVVREKWNWFCVSRAFQSVRSEIKATER